MGSFIVSWVGVIDFYTTFSMRSEFVGGWLITSVSEKLPSINFSSKDRKILSTFTDNPSLNLVYMGFRLSN